MKRSFALAALSLLGLLSPARAWTHHDVPRGLSTLVALACTEDAAFIRSWQQPGEARWDGRGWTSLEGPEHPAYGRSLFATEDHQLFTFASGQIAHYDGTRWRRYDIEAGTTEPGAMWGPSAQEVYLTARGRILRLEGERFRAYDPGTWRDLSAIWGDGSRLFVGGQGGTVMRHDGSTFVRESVPVDRWIRGFAGAGDELLFAWTDGRDAEQALAREPGGWVVRSEGLAGTVAGITTAGVAETYAVSERGVFRLDGERWRPELAPDAMGGATPLGICMTRDHVIVAASYGGTWVEAR